MRSAKIGLWGVRTGNRCVGGGGGGGDLGDGLAAVSDSRQAGPRKIAYPRRSEFLMQQAAGPHGSRGPLHPEDRQGLVTGVTDSEISDVPRKLSHLGA